MIGKRLYGDSNLIVSTDCHSPMTKMAHLNAINNMLPTCPMVLCPKGGCQNMPPLPLQPQSQLKPSTGRLTLYSLHHGSFTCSLQTYIVSYWFTVHKNAANFGNNYSSCWKNKRSEVYHRKKASLLIVAYFKRLLASAASLPVFGDYCCSVKGPLIMPFVYFLRKECCENCGVFEDVVGGVDGLKSEAGQAFAEFAFFWWRRYIAAEIFFIS